MTGPTGNHTRLMITLAGLLFALASWVASAYGQPIPVEVQAQIAAFLLALGAYDTRRPVRQTKAAKTEETP